MIFIRPFGKTLTILFGKMANHYLLTTLRVVWSTLTDGHSGKPFHEGPLGMATQQTYNQ